MFKLPGRRKPTSAPATEEPPLTNEQIEAEHFPGIVPLSPSRREIRWGDLTACPGERQWMVRDGDGLEILVAGEPEELSSAHLAIAQFAMTQFDEVQALAIRLLRSFVHEPGSWSLDELNAGQDADRNRCDFQAALSFSPSSGSDAYGYTSFVVCFRVTKGTHKQRMHPFKTIIEFL